MDTLALGSAFFGGLLLVFGVNLAIADSLESYRRRASTRLAGERRQRQRNRASNSLDAEELQQLVESADSAEARTGMAERFTRMVEQSGLMLRPGQVIGISMALALVGGALAWVVGRQWYYPAFAAPPLALVPVLYVYWAHRRRQEKMLSQLPDVFDMMARMMRAGRTIAQSSQVVADEFAAPVAEEFQYCCEQQNLGLPAEAALRDLAQRTGLLELRIFVLAVIVHAQTGGNLSQLLEKLARIIRDRYRIRGQIKALTAQGRAEAIVLLAMPPIMMAVLLFVARPYIMQLIRFPNLLIGMFVAMLVGALWLRKIVNFDF